MRLTELIIGGTSHSWSHLGLVASNEVSHIAGVNVRFDDKRQGLVSCGFTPSQDDHVSQSLSSLDGLAVQFVQRDNNVDDASKLGSDDLQIIGIDHVVITTDDLNRTSDAVSDGLGVPCARIRKAGHSVTQAFHKLENTILEIVAGPHVKHVGAQWWGFVLTVNDIDCWFATVGKEVASAPRDAVQPGRRISTVHSSVGLGVPVAIMSPHVKTA